MAYTMHTSFIVHFCDQIGDDGHDVKARVNYSVHKAREATLEEPAEGASVTINSLSVDGINAPGWLFEMAEADEGLLNELLAHAADTDEHARDEAADRRREELRDGL